MKIMEIQGETELWQEKQEIEHPKEEKEDCFTPAKLAQPFNPDKEVLVVKCVL